MSRAVVTGGSGFIATRLVPALLEAGWDVVAVGRRARPQWLPPAAGYHVADVTSDDLVAVVSGADAIFHLAGLSSSFAGQEEMERSNIGGTGNVMAAADAAGVGALVHVSSTSIYGESEPLPQPVREDVTPRPSRGYGKAKWAAEQIAWDYADKGLPVVVLRPVTVYGPHNIKLLASAILDAAIERHTGLSSLEVWREPLELRIVHIDDLVAACIHVAGRAELAGRAFNIAQPHYPTSIEVARILADAFGLELAPADDADCGLDYDARKAAHADMVAGGMRPDIMLTGERLRFLRKANRNNRVAVDALLGTGFEFRHADLGAGVASVVGWYERHGWLPRRS